MSDPNSTHLQHDDQERLSLFRSAMSKLLTSESPDSEIYSSRAITLSPRMGPDWYIEIIFEEASTSQDIDTLILSYNCLKTERAKAALTRLLQQDSRWRVFFYIHGQACELELIAHLHPVRHLALIQCPDVSDDYFEHLLSELRSFPNLQVFQLDIRSRPAQASMQHSESGKDRESIPSLFSWISSPSCRLTDFTLRATFYHSVEFYKSLYAAIGQNHTIRRLKLPATNPELNIPEHLCPHLATSSVDIVYLEFPKLEWSFNSDSLLVLASWMIQFRSKRYLTVRFPNARYAHPFRRPEYVSNIHNRWRRGQSTVGCVSFLADVPPTLWSTELERLAAGWDEFDLRSLSLDTSFYLLKLWLSGISQVPNRPPSRQKRRGSLLQGPDSDDDDVDSGFVRLWGKKFKRIEWTT